MRFSQKAARFFTQRAGLIAAIGTLLGAVGALYSVELYKNLRTDIEELLPTTARSVLDLGEVTQRLESIDNLGVLIFSQNPQATQKFVDDLAKELATAPKDVIADVEYKIDQELQFFRARRGLYLDLEDLVKVRDYIRDRIEFEKQLYNPLNIFSQEEIPEPKIDLKGLQKKYVKKVGAYDRFPGGYYATPDGKMRAVLVHLPGKASGVKAGKTLRATVDHAIAKLNPSSYSSDIEIRFTGGVQNLLEEHEALIEDLELSTAIVIVLVTLILLVFYRAWRATFALVTALFVGTLWTFGLSYFVVGYLNANSAFLGGIIIGNGINFGIIFLARYLEERRRGRDHETSLQISLSGTTKATWTAALAAGLAYGSLMLTSFRGFNQFGVIGLIGMILCWTATYTVLPAYLTLLDRLRPLVPKPRQTTHRKFSEFLAYVVSRYPGWIWALSFVATVAAIAMFSRYTPDILETDLSKLRDKTSIESGSAYNARYQDEIFQRYLSPIVIMPKSREHAIEIAEALKEQQRREGQMSLISSVQTIDEFIPRDQPQKIRILKEIVTLIPQRLLQRLNPSQQKLVGEFFRRESFMALHQKDLPPLILKKFTERNGAIGNLVLVEPPLDNATWEGNALIRFIGQLRQIADAVSPGTPVAGQLPVTSDMLEAIQHDGPRATLFAFLAVVVLVIFLFRNAGAIGLTLFALLLGMVWLGGLIFAFDLKINFLNFIALPITFGIGVDYGVNIFQRLKEEGQASIISVIRHTGGAVILASLTTIIGYGSLLLAGNQAFVSFGRLAVLGEITCVTAAVVSLPAYLRWREKRSRRKARAAGPS